MGLETRRASIVLSSPPSAGSNLPAPSASFLSRWYLRTEGHRVRVRFLGVSEIQTIPHQEIPAPQGRRKPTPFPCMGSEPHALQTQLPDPYRRGEDQPHSGSCESAMTGALGDTMIHPVTAKKSPHTRHQAKFRNALVVPPGTRNWLSYKSVVSEWFRSRVHMARTREWNKALGGPGALGTALHADCSGDQSGSRSAASAPACAPSRRLGPASVLCSETSARSSSRPRA